MKAERIAAAETLLDHLSKSECACDINVGVRCEACLAGEALAVLRELIVVWRDREDRAFEALIAFALRSDPEPEPLTAEDVDPANLPELTDEEKARIESMDIEPLLAYAKVRFRPSAAAIDAAVAVYERVVGEATTMGNFGGELCDPNRFSVRVKAGEFKRIVAEAVDAARTGSAEWVADSIEAALREDDAQPESKFGSFAVFFLRQIALEIRCPRSPIDRFDEPAGAVKCSGAPEHLPECGGTCGDLKPTEAEVEYLALDWAEYQKRINASLAKCAAADRQAEMIDAIMAAGLFAATDKGAVSLALAEVFATLIPDGEPMQEIPEGWAPVALAINPTSGEFVTLAGPRSAPDGRVEPLETMLAKWLKDTVADTLGAVREAGRRPIREEGRSFTIPERPHLKPKDGESEK